MFENNKKTTTIFLIILLVAAVLFGTFKAGMAYGEYVAYKKLASFAVQKVEQTKPVVKKFAGKVYDRLKKDSEQ